MNFEAGSKVVYAGHGVATVTKVVTKSLGGGSKQFYVLETALGGMTVMCPVGSEQVRAVSDKDKAGRMLRLALEPLEASPRSETWNRRYRENLERLQTGSVENVVTVYRELRRVRADRDLSFGERKMLDHARETLALELSASLDVSLESMITLLVPKGVE